MTVTTTTHPLVERYVAAVSARLPADQRTDVGDELRGSILDSVEDRLDHDPTADREAVVRDVLLGLGDPAVLAQGYAATPRYVVGPENYDTWRGLVLAISLVAAPITAVVTLVARIWAEDPYLEAIIGSAWTGFTVAVHVAFWVTLTFWIIERTGTEVDAGADPWTPDDLPELPRDRTIGLKELVGGVGFLVLVLAWLPWQHYRSPVDDVSGQRVPLLDPALWSGWLWGFVALVVLAVVVELIKYAVGHWTLAVTLLAVAADVLMGAFLVALLTTQTIVNPALSTTGEVTTTVDATVLVVSLVVVAIGVGEAVRGHLRHRAQVS